MDKLSLTSLRQNLFRVVDQVVDTGAPVAVERRGRTILLVLEGTQSKLSRLKKRKLIKGNPEDLVAINVSQWHEPDNLR